MPSKKMKTIVILILSAFCLTACQSEEKNEAEVSAWGWNNIRKNFPKKNQSEFDFSPSGEPLNDIEDLPKLDSVDFNHIVKQIKTYDNWKEYLELYYYSLNYAQEIEFGIFLSIVEFDGTTYSFDLISFNDNGEVDRFEPLANSWQAAECFGYQRSSIDFNEEIMISQKLQKCYDENAPNHQAIDSVVTKTSLENLIFKVIETDTIKK